MIRVHGEESLDQSPELVWQFLARPEFLCRCFPGVDRVLRCDDRSAAIIVRPGFSFVRGTLEISFDFADADPPRSARVLIHIKGIGSSAELESRVELTADGSGSRAAWSAESIHVGGLLKAVSRGLMQAAAQKVATETWAEIRQRLCTGS